MHNATKFFTKIIKTVYLILGQIVEQKVNLYQQIYKTITCHITMEHIFHCMFFCIFNIYQMTLLYVIFITKGRYFTTRKGSDNFFYFIDTGIPVLQERSIFNLKIVKRCWPPAILMKGENL